MDYVVLIDSNAIIGNNYKIKNKALDDFFKRNQLVLSEPTPDEVIRKYNKVQEENEKKLQEAVKNASKFGIRSKIVELERLDFGEVFHKELYDLKTQILLNERASINFIYNKSLWLEKPFKNKNNKEAGGFRDALIWNLWLEYLNENHEKYNEIIIINQDSDFVKDRKLAADLKDDLECRYIPIEKVSVLNSIKSLTELALYYLKYEQNNDVIELDELEEIQSKIIQSAFEEGLEDAIEKKISERIPKEQEPSIDFIGRNNNTHTDSISGSKEEVYLYFTEKFTVSISYFMMKNDYLVDLPRNVVIEDSDWNEWVMHVREDFKIEIGFESFINLFHIEITEFNYYIEEELTPLTDGSHHDEEMIHD